jgi:hypothetical protein
MKSMLLTLTVLGFIGAPASFLAESAGIKVPEWGDWIHVLSAFVSVVVILTALGEYSPTPARSRSIPVIRGRKSAHPLAA